MATKDVVDEVVRLMKLERADLTTTVSSSPVPHDKLVEASKSFRFMFRYSPPTDWVRSLTKDVVLKQIEASVHEHTDWAARQTSPVLQMNMARFICAFEVCQIRCGSKQQNGIFSCPPLGLVLRIDPRFGCIYCGDSDTKVADRRYCQTCQVSTFCNKCASRHTKADCALSGLLRPQIEPHLVNASVCCRCLRTAAEKMKRCGRCKTARYCSKACQVADWTAVHRSECDSFI